PSAGEYLITFNTGQFTDSAPVPITILPNSDIASITPNTGLLQPSNFNTEVHDYDLYVNAEFRSITLTPVSVDPLAVITVNDVVVNSGSPSANIPLPVFENFVTVKAVTTESGRESTTTYNYRVIRGPVVPGNLFDLTISNGELSPVFVNSVFDYTASTNNESITVTPTADEGTATIRVKINDGDYALVTNRSASAALPLNVGENVIKVSVTSAQQDVSKTYTLTVTRLISTDASLAGLTTTAGNINPAFTTGNNTYSASVQKTSITVTPVTAEAHATVQARVVGGEYVAVANNTASAELPLGAGNNTIEVLVTAQDGTTQQTYTLNVNRLQFADMAATLTASSIAVNVNGTVTFTATITNTGTNNSAGAELRFHLPGFFNPGTLDVTNITGGFNSLISPGFDPGLVSIYGPLASGSSASITFTVNTAGDASGAADLVVAASTSSPSDPNNANNTDTVSIRVFSANTGLAGVTVIDGAVTTELETSAGPLSAAVSSATTSVKIIPAAADDATVQVRVNGGEYATVADTEASADLPLNFGNNTIDILVTAENGTATQLYTLNITRLANIATTSFTLSPNSKLARIGTGTAMNNYKTSVAADATT
ncbi:MAG: cadherin-like beta sandwich domain-containing protein, partial [Sphingobacteriales bacterium]